MALRHTNPTQKRYDRRSGQYIEARAPYNFIPLPEKVVPAPWLPDLDIYHQKALTCSIDVLLETLSPTYIRGMMTQDQFERLSNKEVLSPEEEAALAPFFDLHGRPVIPGSSLRGMIRSIVEIASYSHIRWVAPQPTFTFRAVAAQKDDPLAAPYQVVIGRLAANVRAGYFEKKGEEWYIRPAILPSRYWSNVKEAFLKIKESRIGSRDIPGFVRLNSPDYRPYWYRVRFDATLRGRGVVIDRIGDEKSGYRYKGVLVCSGNMVESGKKSAAQSRRTSHTIILEPDQKANPIKVSDQAIKDYLDGLTPFQMEQLRAWSGNSKQGCLGDGAPVFYVVEDDEVTYFGHSPNFRIPMRLHGEKRAATPHDFVPLDMRQDTQPDMTDALFGWVEDPAVDGNAPPGQRAGRVFVSDAVCLTEGDDLWFSEHPVALHILSSPKPTTFQHYLVQSKESGHNPDNKGSLAHYGTPPGETWIRGFKRYWHRGASPDIVASEEERKLETQITFVRPLKAGVKFTFRIHLENLLPAELGALLWALNLPGESGKQYVHKIGMGKPLGMGAVRLTIERLTITDRQQRYRRLFAEGGTDWHTAAQPADAETYIRAFEEHVLNELGAAARGVRRLAELERIKMLLVMHEWPGPDPDWTRYMKIEHTIGNQEVNEYKERPVLPDPLGVLQQAQTEARPPRAAPQPQNLPSGYETGKVKKFGLGPMKDFGFIAPDKGGEDVYVNLSRLAKGVESLRQGQRVRYRRVRGARGDQAIDVQVIDEG